MASNEARATQCRTCGKKACMGACKKCPLRLQGECKSYFIPVTKIDKPLEYEWECAECFFTKGDSMSKEKAHRNLEDNG